MKRALLSILLVFSFLPVDALAKRSLNCQISIRNHYFNGEVQKVSFRTRLQSEAECKQLATMHRPNWDPEKISKKNVFYTWLKKQPSHSLSKASPKTKRRLRR